MAELTEFLANNPLVMNEPINLKRVNFNVPQQLVRQSEGRTVKSDSIVPKASHNSMTNNPPQTIMQMIGKLQQIRTFVMVIIRMAFPAIRIEFTKQHI